MSGMSVPAPLDSDRAHLLHPLHHPAAYASTRIWVSGDGAVIKDATGEPISPRALMAFYAPLVEELNKRNAGKDCTR